MKSEVNKSPFSFVAIGSILIGSVLGKNARADSEFPSDLTIQLELSSLQGTSFEPNPSGARISVTASDFDRATYPTIDSLLSGLDADSQRQAFRRIVFAVKAMSATGEISSSSSAYLRGDRLPAVSILESDLHTFLSRFEGTGVAWGFRSTVSNQDKRISDDFREYLRTRRATLIRLVEAVEAVLSIEDFGSRELEISESKATELRRIQSEIESALIGKKGIPARFIVDHPTQGAVVDPRLMSKGESQVHERIHRALMSLRSWLRMMEALRADPIQASLRRSGEYRGVLAELMSRYEIEGRDVRTALERNDKAVDFRSSRNQVARAVEHQLYDLRFSRGLYIPLIPLHSYGMIQLLNLVEASYGYLDVFQHESVEAAMIRVLGGYTSNEFVLDPASRELLIRVYQLPGLDPLLRLAAFSILESKVGKVTASQLCQMPDRVFRKWFEASSRRVVSSPGESTPVRSPTIDFGPRTKASVWALVRTIDEAASRRGIAPMTYETRAEIFDPLIEQISSPSLERRVVDEILRPSRRGAILGCAGMF